VKTVRCVSPHGGCANGMWHNGQPVFALPDGTIPAPDPATLRLPPNPGGYIVDVRIPGTFAAVGQEYEVPDDFQANGFHWEDVAPPARKPPAAPPPPATETTTAGE
jgi:hypothetical protein